VIRTLPVAVAVAVAIAAAVVLAAPAGAARECSGFQVCVPVAGPWVLSMSRTETQYQLACPKRFVVGGLDAELTNPAIDLVFRATLGSPVNPGISTSTTAVFLGRLSAGNDPRASFKPLIGCVPTSGSGSRVPTSVQIFRPGSPTVRRVAEIPARAGATRRVVATCKTGEKLVTSSEAVGFYTALPPGLALATAVHVQSSTAHGHVTVAVRAGSAVRGVRAVVQLDLVCAGGR
jgi:hypothetical protein